MKEFDMIESIKKCSFTEEDIIVLTTIHQLNDMQDSWGGLPI